jgi:hypothetical protein
MTDDELTLILDVARIAERVRTTLDERVALVEDHRRLTDLVMLYGWLCDARRWDELLELYTDDFERTLLGTLDEKVKGKEKLRELYAAPALPRSDGGAAGAPPASLINTYELRHLIHPPVVRVSDDGRKATVVAVYGLVATVGDGPEFRRGEHEGGYIFGFRREPDVGWRFETMIVISENARNPLFSAA